MINRCIGVMEHSIPYFRSHTIKWKHKRIFKNNSLKAYRVQVTTNQQGIQWYSNGLKNEYQQY